jgi:hypothetical protein
VWDVSAKHHIERKKPMPYVNHYSFHILDPDWGHLIMSCKVRVFIDMLVDRFAAQQRWLDAKAKHTSSALIS